MFLKSSVQNPPERGMALVGHGTQDQRGLAEFHQLANQVSRLAPGYAVEPCFLEIARPDIPATVARMLDRGIRQIVVAPVLLFAAGHAKRDIPAAVQDGLDDASCRVIQTPALECHEAIVELSARRFQQCLDGVPEISPDQTLLVLVARGSSEASAIAQMHRFATMRAARTPVGRVEVCFAAVASPGLEETLERAAQTDFRRIVVQPHLLFAGRVLNQVETAVRTMSARVPDRQWLVAPHLGPHGLVAEAILDLCYRAVEAPLEESRTKVAAMPEVSR